MKVKANYKINTMFCKSLFAVILFLSFSCNKTQDDLKPNTDFLLVAKKTGSEFYNMVSFSLDKLGDANAINSDADKQVEIVKNGIKEWIFLNDYNEKGKDYFNSIIDSNSQISLELKSSSNRIFENYSSEQYEIIQRILAIAEISSSKDFQVNIESVEESISKLPENEQLELLTMIEMIKGACNAISDFETPVAQNSLKSFGSFMCNLASGGIGSIYGAWAGGIAAGVFGASAIATGGVSIAVGLVVGAAISTIAC